MVSRLSDIAEVVDHHFLRCSKQGARTSNHLIPHHVAHGARWRILLSDVELRWTRRIGVLTDPAALARILYDYDKMMSVRGDRLVKHSDKLYV
jgi:hypothetical protein